MLTKNEIKQRIKENSHILKQYHIGRIGIFGSYARGNATENSDIDLIVDFTDTISLFQYVRLTDSIAAVLDQNVDLVTIDGLKPRIQNTIMKQVELIEGL